MEMFRAFVSAYRVLTEGTTRAQLDLRDAAGRDLQLPRQFTYAEAAAQPGLTQAATDELVGLGAGVRPGLGGGHGGGLGERNLERLLGPAPTFLVRHHFSVGDRLEMERFPTAMVPWSLFVVLHRGV